MSSEESLSGVQLYLRKLSLFTRNAKLVLTYSAMTGLAFGVFRLLFNFYVLSLGGYDERFLGMLTSLSSAGSLVIALPAAYLAERYSHKRIMVVTGWISALAFAGLVLLPTRGSLIVFNMVLGLTMSIRQIVIAPFLMNNTGREERQYVFSFQYGLNTVASFAGNLLGGLLPTWLGIWAGAGPTDSLSYQLALGSMVLVSALAVGPLMFLIAKPRDTSVQAEMPWTLLKRNSVLLGKLILPNWIIGLGAGMMMPFMNLYYRNVFGQSDSIIGYLMGSGLLAMAIAQFVAPPMADRMGKIPLVVVSQAISVPFLLMLGLAAWIVPRGGGPVLWFIVAWVAYLIRLAAMNMSGPVYQTFILEQVPDNVQALAASLNNVAFQFGWVLSPQISGYFQTHQGWVPVFVWTTVLYVIGIVVTWAFFRDAVDTVPQDVERAEMRASMGD